MTDEGKNCNVKSIKSYNSLKGAVVLLTQGQAKVKLHDLKLIKQLQALCMCFVVPM